MATKRFCDLCGAEIELHRDQQARRLTIELVARPPHGGAQTKDVCATCWPEVDDTLKRLANRVDA